MPPPRLRQAVTRGARIASGSQASHCSSPMPSWRELTSEEILASLSPSTCRSDVSGFSSFRSSTLLPHVLESSLRTTTKQTEVIVPATATREKRQERGLGTKLNKESRESRHESDASEEISDGGSYADWLGSPVKPRTSLGPSPDGQLSSGLGRRRTCQARPSGKPTASTRRTLTEKREDSIGLEEKLVVEASLETECRTASARRAPKRSPAVSDRASRSEAAQIAFPGSHLKRSIRGFAPDEAVLERESQLGSRVCESSSAGALAEQTRMSRGVPSRRPSLLRVARMPPPKIHSVRTSFGPHPGSPELIPS